jgi:hypothetical protein
MSLRRKTGIGLAVAVLTAVMAHQVRSQLEPGDEGDFQKRTTFIRTSMTPLDRYVAHWRVTERHYDDKGEMIATVQGLEEILWVLDTNAIYRRYYTSSDVSSYKAIGLLTFNDQSNSFKGVWFDNVSPSGPMNVDAKWDEASLTMVYTSKGTTQDGKDVEYLKVEKFADEENRTATTYVVEGDVKRKVLEVHYKRAEACPGSTAIRIMDG